VRGGGASWRADGLLSGIWRSGRGRWVVLGVGLGVVFVLECCSCKPAAVAQLPSRINVHSFLTFLALTLIMSPTQEARRLAEQQAASSAAAAEREPWHSGLTPSEVSLDLLEPATLQPIGARQHQNQQQHHKQQQQPHSPKVAAAPPARRATGLPYISKARSDSATQPPLERQRDTRTPSPLRSGSAERSRPLSASAALAASGERTKRHRVRCRCSVVSWVLLA